MSTEFYCVGIKARGLGRTKCRADDNIKMNIKLAVRFWASFNFTAS
jgi:hypothetical protein